MHPGSTLRWRTISYNMTPAATDTFSHGTFPSMGIEIVRHEIVAHLSLRAQHDGAVHVVIQRGKQNYDALDYNMDCAIVLGSEGQGCTRSGGEKVRLPGFDPHAGEGAVAECVGRGGCHVVRNRAPAQDKSCGCKMKSLRVLCVLCGLLVQAHAIDREAFTFTHYNLDVRIEPEQQRLAVRGKITVRNDSASPQKILSLQISSSLDWRSIQLEGKPAQFVSQPYTSDIDHTGALSEALVTLPQAVPPKGEVELEIGYEGVISLDATRLTRIGVPADVARHSDWDQIAKSFSAVRGIGYVAWYPVATESANLSEANSVFETVARWKARELQADMKNQNQSFWRRHACDPVV